MLHFVADISKFLGAAQAVGLAWRLLIALRQIVNIFVVLNAFGAPKIRRFYSSRPGMILFPLGTSCDLFHLTLGGGCAEL